MSKWVKKSIMFITVLALMCGAIPFSDNYGEVYAAEWEEEYQEFYQPEEEPIIPDPAFEEPQQEEPAPDPYEYSGEGQDPDEGWLGISDHGINLGTISRDDYGAYFYVSAYNRGRYSHDVMYDASCLTDGFIVEAPGDTNLAPGESCTFAIRANNESGAYTHNGTITLYGYDVVTGYMDSEACSLTFTVEDPKPYITSVTVSPKNVSGTPGATLYFGAVVTGGNGYDNGVAWSLSGHTSARTYIEENGTLHLGADERGGKIKVKAVSIEDRNFSDSTDVTITQTQYTVSVAAFPAYGGSVAGDCTLSKGQSTTVYAAPANGFKFEGWYLGNGVKVSSDAAFYIRNIDSNLSLVANFVLTDVKVTVKKNNELAGKVTASATIPYGSDMTLQAVANSGYSFKEWSENGSRISTDATYVLKGVSSNREITAVFDKSVYMVNVAANPLNSGIVAGAGSYKKGSEAVLTATPAKGYVFKGWFIDNNIVSTSVSYKISNIDRDYNVVGVFEAPTVKNYTVAIACGEGGTISPSGNVSVQEGKSLVVTISPSSGYKIANVAVDNQMVGAHNSITLNNINQNHTVAACFEKTKVISKQQSGSGSNSSQNNMKIDVIPVSDSKKESSAKEDKKEEKTEEATLAGEVNTDLPIDNAVIEEVHEEEAVLEDSTGNDLLSKMNMSEEEAEAIIKSGSDYSIMYAALVNGNLSVAVSNEYSSIYQETASPEYSKLTNAPNFEEVVDRMFTPEEKMIMLKGGICSANLNVASASGKMSVTDRKYVEGQKRDELVVSDYMDIIMLKGINGVTENVTKLDVPVRIVLNVPDYLVGVSDEFSILRLHIDEDGTRALAELPDEDDNPNTITFSTDVFSTYAIAYVPGENAVAGRSVKSAKYANETNNKLQVIILIVLIILVIGLVINLVVLIRRHKQKRLARMRRKNVSVKYDDNLK